MTTRQPSRKLLRYKRKVFILRMEELLLLIVIVALLLTRRESISTSTVLDSIEVQAASTICLSQNQIEEEYEWLQQHSELFPEGKVASSEGNIGLIHFLYEYGNGIYDAKVDAKLTSEEAQSEIPLFIQWDERWGFTEYGDSNIGICGCGPTCLAMVIEGLTRDQNVTPKSVAEYAMSNGFYMEGTGTKWSLFEKYACQQNVICTNCGINKTDIYLNLQQGHPVICSMGPGTITTGGHFIVLCGLKDGNVIINDPNDVNLSAKLWNWDSISSEIKNAWAFSNVNI